MSRGEIHKSLMELQQLNYLNLSWNSFQGRGTLEFLSSLSNLRYLDLSYSDFGGKIPTQFGSLSNLKYLDLAWNSLEGSIPRQIGNLSQLQHLDLRFNSFEGNIPSQIGNLSQLQHLDLSDNSLEGNIPSQIGNLSQLQHLDLSMNQINGTLPDLSIFSSLRGLYLEGNKLNGEIPKDIKFPPQLERLDMQSNSLKGVLTDYHFANMSKLDHLDLSDNSLLALAFSQNWVPPFQLSHIGLRSCKLGPVFPKWLETQNQFDDIDISNAGIADMVPKWFWANLAFQEWISMNISYNNLRGIIPNFPTKNIQYSLTLGPNQFNGPIPPFLRGSQILDLSHNKFSDSLSFLCVNRTIETLYQLDLSNNHFSGKEIPRFLIYPITNSRKLTSLDFLDLSRNHLVGSIPSSLTQIDRLGVLDLSHNNLSGEIPTGTQLQTFNASCYEDNLDLCGPPLEKLCADGKPPQEPIVKLPEDEKLLFTREFYMSMAIGFVISFWGVFGSILIKRSWRHAYFKFISNLSDAIYVMVAQVASRRIAGASLLRWKIQRDTFGGEKASLTIGFGDRERIKEGF
ncbi:Probably inactive leucine-rich repeat receptor-like protein kinase [Glycine soja]|uniref:Probably inactive leucine-rich repeat receptor-like protein kinase n=1 Tax=Glycine soja TaxID=3848 RepID=A0A0B2QDT8_GLYSO|nr:Probably inactive leucine-rich repeat receptor-like protein kinase [Glycine soja]